MKIEEVTKAQAEAGIINSIAGRYKVERQMSKVPTFCLT